MSHTSNDKMPSGPKPSFGSLKNNELGIVGAWTANELVNTQPKLPGALLQIDLNEPTALVWSFSNVAELDTFGATALAAQYKKLSKLGYSITFEGGEHRHLELVQKLIELDKAPEPVKNVRRTLPIDTLGRIIVEAGKEGVDFVTVQGQIIVSLLRMITLRGPIRFAAVVNQFHEIILRAIPIVILISLVVGVILTQQTIEQLKNFGAIIFVVDLSSILMLREIGILLAAIMVAGRSGSAITAEIGAMRMREEIDALEVMGLDTYRAVVMPRVIALIVGLPALGLIGALAGILGAALAARITGGVALDVFVARLNDVVDLQSIAVGLIKAPLMALAIAIIAVQEGLQVSGSTQSLGRHTTASVVKSIFIVIVLDGIFAVYFGAIGF
ncbi:MlaE family ABC transporter permease [Maritalea porphyrae]|uniref:MlaE family ABC transporter permease n=1 Tax=Maritalea porphyrae TaxID=880732 RepID=UPI0022AEC05C|nr:ABC transporter permease [Maritalea porphyrae]MCZ4273461.1 ABC transporter permease [Maritalea porphyrae]